MKHLAGIIVAFLCYEIVGKLWGCTPLMVVFLVVKAHDLAR